MPRCIQAREAFYRVEHNPSKGINVYIHAVDTARKALKDLGCVIDDTEAKDVLLMNLHSSYLTVRTSILTAKEEPTFADVKSILSSSSAAVDPIIKLEPSDTAFAVRSGSSTQRRLSSRGQDFREPSQKDDKGIRWCDPTNEGHCHRCGRPGHIAARCIHNMPQHIKDWVMSVPRSSAEESNSAQVESAFRALHLVDEDEEVHIGVDSEGEEYAFTGAEGPGPIVI